MESYYGRESFIESYQKLLDETSSTQFLMTGKWGSGKSTIVEKLVLDINCSKEFKGDSDDSLIKPQKAIRIDAWENDYIEDPNLLLLSELFQNGMLTTDEFKAIPKSEFTKTGLSKFLLEIGNGLLESYTGVNSTKVMEQIKSDEQSYYDSSLDQLSQAAFYRTMAEKTLSTVIAGKYDSLIIFVDEIDRCKPDFALRLIERFHHLNLCGYFVKFVYVSDKDALTDIVDNYYGFGDRSFEYLEKMFDSIIEVPSLTPFDLKLYFKTIWSPNGALNYDYHFGMITVDKYLDFFNRNNMTFRNINRFSEDILNRKFKILKDFAYLSREVLKRNYQQENDLLSDQNNLLIIEETNIISFYQVLILLQWSTSKYQIGIRDEWFNSEIYRYQLIIDYYASSKYFEVVESCVGPIQINDKHRDIVYLESFLSTKDYQESEITQIKKLYAILNRFINKDPNFTQLIY